MEEADFGCLPESCVSHILALTSPRDVCRSSAISSVFRRASDSDAVWRKFLPEDYLEILSRSVCPLKCSSKKELYMRLCHPILMDDGKKIFWLEMSTGRKCYMLSASELGIVWGDSPRYWRWSALSESRFSRVAELLMVCWLEITGRLSTEILSPKTTYVAYLVLKVDSEGYGLHLPPAELSVKLGDQISTHTARLQLRGISRRRPPGPLSRLFWLSRYLEEYPTDARVPRERGDGWMELEVGEFYVEDGNNGVVEVSLMEVKGGEWKRGLIVEGLEIRPKKE